jgi:hypothetical protein
MTSKDDDDLPRDEEGKPYPQIDELVKRAKRFAIDMRNHSGPPETCPSPSDYDMEDFADALEVQAARVKELELANTFNEAQLKRANVRIAALEAELDIANKQIAETGRAWTADRERLETQLEAFRVAAIMGC